MRSEDPAPSGKKRAPLVVATVQLHLLYLAIPEVAVVGCFSYY